MGTPGRYGRGLPVWAQGGLVWEWTDRYANGRAGMGTGLIGMGYGLPQEAASNGSSKFYWIKLQH
ncbi:hypothetical protein KL86DES1_20126 [uncultured Desulfovibrio sp.]|uniref:Uncharacterized protein n=1 Tax=uncultured Desulfovibrio sp. TaxID=167968 RepID=A0A212L2U7_9BACT|nr:hypothetical protein KL86DES1_20126 [uncultured Desulfovibrio sp.]VZH33025.1 conserved protein of unknown function [Desulfovibrio sp. 86]